MALTHSSPNKKHLPPFFQSELCVELQRNAVYWFAEMFCPALVTAGFTLAAVLFQLALPQAFLLAFSILCQLLNLQLINARLPNYMGTLSSICIKAGKKDLYYFNFSFFVQ
jgi:hypothetical protein